MGFRFRAIFLIAFFVPAAGQAQSILSTILGGSPYGLPALSAPMNLSSAVITDSQGNIYVALRTSHQVVRIDAAGKVWAVAGSGGAGFAGDGGPATSATLSTPVGLALDSSGALYIVDSTASRVRRVGPDGIITTVAGNGQNAFTGDGGPAIKASLFTPAGIAVDSQGDLIIADTGNYVVRKVTPDGIIQTIAGMGGVKGSSGNGGPALQAFFYNVQSVLVDKNGNIFIADTGNNWIRVLAPDGTLTLYGGIDQSTVGSPLGGGGDPTVATSAQLYSPTSLTMDQAGTLYFVEPSLYRIRQITANGKIAPFAGTGTYGSSGDQGLARFANLNVQGIATDPQNNVLIADGNNNRVRKVTAGTGVIDTIAGNGLASFSPRGLAVSGGYLYFSDTTANRIRRFNLDTQEISLVAGNGSAAWAGDGDAALSASLNAPRGLAFDSTGNLYIADTGNNRIRKIDTSGDISTIAGNGTATTTGDGGVATASTIHNPFDVAVDGSGNLFIAEQAGNVIRKVNTNGVISTVAGTGIGGAPDSENGVAISQKLSGPQSLGWDLSGGLLIADSGNNRIRRLAADGTIATVAGSSGSGSAGDGGPATAATLRSPNAVRVDQSGNLYISDANNYKIRRVGTDGIITTVAGNGAAGFNGDGSPATAYSLNGVSALAPGVAGCNVYIADTSNLRLRQLWPSIDYTLSANAPGLQLSLDGQTSANPLTVSLLPGTHHVLDAPSPQAGGTGVQYVLTAPQQFDVPCGATETSITLTFQLQYALTVAADSGGTVNSASGWQNAGASATLNATPQSGYVFTGWEGDCTGTGACTILMNAPKNVKAHFSQALAEGSLTVPGYRGRSSSPAKTSL